jgi:RNA polymerase sigma-70 factor (ECF subfamily)
MGFQTMHALNEDSKFLINRLRKGEGLAYELLFKEYYKVLTVFANKYVNDLETAKELVQDLFVHLYEKREYLDINSSLKSYLFRSTHNRCINYINAKKIRIRHADYIMNNADIQDNILEQEVNKTELEHALYKAINQLPPKCRSIFKMNRFEGLSNGEIAERLKLSKRTVETQISKALKILRVKIEPYMAVGVFIFIAIRLIGSLFVIL